MNDPQRDSPGLEVETSRSLAMANNEQTAHKGILQAWRLRPIIPNINMDACVNGPQRDSPGLEVETRHKRRGRRLRLPPQRDSPSLEVEVSSPPACQRSMSTQRRLSIVILL